MENNFFETRPLADLRVGRVTVSCFFFVTTPVSEIGMVI